MDHQYETTVRVTAANGGIGHLALSAIRDAVETSLMVLEPGESGQTEIVSDREIRVTLSSQDRWGDNVRALLREAIGSDLNGILDGDAGESITVDEITDADPAPTPGP